MVFGAERTTAQTGSFDWFTADDDAHWFDHLDLTPRAPTCPQAHP
jgi:hypothetical protein